MAAMTPGQILDRAIQLAQLATLVGGMIVVSFMVGRRDQVLATNGDDISELKSIVKEISTTQVNLLAFDAASAEGMSSIREKIADIRERLSSLEAKR